MCLTCLSNNNVAYFFVFIVRGSDGSHSVDFEEYLSAVSVFLRGSFDDKVKCTQLHIVSMSRSATYCLCVVVHVCMFTVVFFNIWDADNSGSITESELRDFVRYNLVHLPAAIFSLLPSALQVYPNFITSALIGSCLWWGCLGMPARQRTRRQH